MEREDQAVRQVLVVVSREVQQESPLGAIRSGEVDLIALSSAALLHLRIEGLAAAFAGPSVCLAKEQAKAKHAKTEKSNSACHDNFSLTSSVYRGWKNSTGQDVKDTRYAEKGPALEQWHALSTNAARTQQLEMEYATKNIGKLPS